MKVSGPSNIKYTSTSITKNTVFNLLGYGIPLIIGLVIIPFLIKGLGEEKFGILILAWGVVGYFSFLDLGIGRALTKIIAEKISLKKYDEIPGLFWTSFLLLLIVSLAAIVVFIILNPILVYKILNITANHQKETLNTFYLLAISIPIVTTTAGIRGVLEAYQKFGIINIIRIILGVSSFLGPLLCLIFTNSLVWIVVILVFIRIVVWILYLIECLKVNNNLVKIYLDTQLIKPILRLSGWMTVSNIIIPIFVYIDKFLIGAMLSTAAIAYYATPYEAITKLLLVPGALVGVLFPAFSATYVNDPEYTNKLSMRAIKYTFIFLFPIIFVIIIFAQEAMTIWLGYKFAQNSYIVLQFLAAGVLFNSIGYIPFTFLQGIGKPEITAKVNLIELPVYVLAMWLAIKQEGVIGAALVWMIRMLVDTVILYLFAQKEISVHFPFRLSKEKLLLTILFLISLVPIFIPHIFIKLILVVIILTVFLYTVWKYFLSQEEKILLKSRIKTFSI